MTTRSADLPTDVPSTVAEALARLPRVVDLLAARAEEHDRDATFPYQGVEALHEAGLLTLTLAPRYGGPGGTLADTVRVLGQLGRGDASVAVLAAFTLLQHAEQARAPRWPAPVYRKLLAESRRGPALVDTLRTEPGGGLGLPATVARRAADGSWVLHGRKTYCAGSEALAWMAVWARTDEPAPRTGLFLVRGDAEGIEIDPVWDQLGLRASAGHDVLFDGVRVPVEAAVGLAEAGGPRSEAVLAAERLDLAWRDLALSAVLLGVARAAQGWLVRFLDRKPPANLTELPPVSGPRRPGEGHSLANLPRYRTALGEMESSLIAAEELVSGLAAGVDRGEPTAVNRAAAAQLTVNRTATTAVQQAVALAGNPGLSRRHPLERHLRDILSGRVYFPAEEVVLDALGCVALERGTRRAH
ncbi:acyl-CoA dehydrogenase family protein [Kitasatospora cystarginea]|uniref:Acyl-CoA dehydrogenase family protein n=1 Tax=Kitasatospora cystarginea TaxID=58350 RepID=A0ABN3ETE6_9ACTN